MAKKTEVRFSEGGFIALIAVIALVVVGISSGWFAGGATSSGGDAADQPATLTLVPAIEKTKVFISAYDLADFEGENQQNRVAGTTDLIKSGNVIDQVTTLTSAGAASTAEFNGGDKVIALADATGYYAKASEEVTISETLQPIEVSIKAEGTPDVYIEDDNGDVANTTVLAANEVSKTFSIIVERPGDDTYYQMCGIAADYDDEVIRPQLRVAGSFEDGLTVLDETYDDLDTAGYDAVWEFDEEIKNFNELSIDFIVDTEKDVDPSGATLDFAVFDCEENLQNGEIVYTSEDSADADLGQANIVEAFVVN